MNWKLLGVATACAAWMLSLPCAAGSEMTATFYSMSKGSFGIQVVAPTSVVREYAICKAIWFAEKMKAAQVSLGNPHYDIPKPPAPVPAKVPKGWSVLTTTAYLSDPNPDGNPVIEVSDKDRACRKMWDWFG